MNVSQTEFHAPSLSLSLSLSLFPSLLQCSVLLFIVGGDTLSVGSMVEVAYYIGCGRRLVLVLNDIPCPQDDNSYTTLEGMEVSTHHKWYCMQYSYM